MPTNDVKMTDVKESWGSRFGLILAMAGNAVGLGNFLRFPVQAVQNGGGAFIIPYLISFVVLGLPLMVIEWASGKYGGCYHGYNSTPFILQSLSKRKICKYIGVFGIFSNIVIASYYCYIESWTMTYAYFSVAGTFRGMSEGMVSQFFDNYLDLSISTTGIPYEAVFFYIVCLVLNIWILSRGLQKGVEKVAKIGMPLLILFGIFLSVKAITIKAGHQNAICDGVVGLNFLWTPQYSSLADPKVWLAAAGQIFFTLSLGMGCVQCYSSYLKRKDDIVLSSLTTGFTNEFCEIVIGSAVIIPISVGYFGIDKVVELASFGGFGLGFRSMPYLFSNWGPIMGAFAGVAFFGLLFFAGITSSLAMGSPIIAFFKDGFSISRKKASVLLGIIIFIYGLPTVLFFKKGVFDEYDYWGGTVALFVFAMLESVIFSWGLGLKKGWNVIREGAELNLPSVFKLFIKYVTPVLLIVIFLAAMFKPKNDDWSSIGFKGWELDKTSIVGELKHKDIGPNGKWFSNTFYSEITGVVDAVIQNDKKCDVFISNENTSEQYSFNNAIPIVKVNDTVTYGDELCKGKIVNTVFYSDFTRIILLILFVMICLLVKKADRNIIKRRLFNSEK